MWQDLPPGESLQCKDPNTGSTVFQGKIDRHSGGAGCSRCGYGTLSGTGSSSCSASNRRRLNDELPVNMVPRHRALMLGCAECATEEVKAAFQYVDNNESALLEAEQSLQTCVDDAEASGGTRSLFRCVMIHAIKFISIMPLLSSVTTCQLGQELCYTADDLSTSPGLVNLLLQSKRLESFIELSLLPFGGNLHVDEEVTLLDATLANQTQFEAFSSVLIEATSEGGENGESISASELLSLNALNLEVPNSIDIEAFAMLWNKSLDMWSMGVFSEGDYMMGNETLSMTPSFFDLSLAKSIATAYTDARRSIHREGFNGFGDAWLSAVEGQQYEEAKKLAGVCAAVRVRIEQELTLTRTGFEAQLEIRNDGSSPLTDLSVILRAAPFGNVTSDATELFVFGAPNLDGVTAVDGTGMVGSETTGQATWLIIPLTEAAPMFETKYDIGGILTYSIDGVEYVQTLGSDFISVQPDPQLFLTYFHSRLAYSDDPFTKGLVEPSVPFFLGLLIENRGYGDARNVEIVSSQPEILENEKGLLVDFQIVGARLGNEPTSKALRINFGTVESRSKTIGVWDLVSTLRGRFYNFSATFEYEGPIDDDRLSLIESVEIYELLHLVRVTGDHPATGMAGLGYIDDGLDDFLINSRSDAYYLPDTVMTSDTRERSYLVSNLINTLSPTTEEPTFLDDGTVQVVVQQALENDRLSRLEDWVYLRFDDPLSGTDYILQSATRMDYNYTLIPQSNSWQTSWTEYYANGTIEIQDYIHLFDLNPTGTQEYLLWYALQQPVTNLQVTSVTEMSITISWDDAAGATSSYVMAKPIEAIGDQYYRMACSYIQINTCTVSKLQAGTKYSIKVFTGQLGNYERTGTAIEAETTGNNTCGNSIVDPGEDCDDGNQNSMTMLSNCTFACLWVTTGKFVKTLASENPSDSPSMRPSDHPSMFPSMLPSDSPSMSPSNDPSHRPSQLPSDTPSDLPSVVPSSTPSFRPSASPSQDPSQQPSSSPSDFPSVVPSSQPTSTMPVSVPTPNKPTSENPWEGCFAGNNLVEILDPPLPRYNNDDDNNPTATTSYYNLATTIVPSRQQQQPPRTKLVRLDSLQIGDFVRVGGSSSTQEYSMIYSFAHYDTTTPTQYLQIYVDSRSTASDNDTVFMDNVTTTTTTATITTQPQSPPPLEISENHLVFAFQQGIIRKEGRKPSIIPASDLQVGDFLLFVPPPTFASIMPQVPDHTSLDMLNNHQQQRRRRHPYNVVPIVRIDTVIRSGAYAPLTWTGNIVISNVLSSNYVSILSFSKETVKGSRDSSDTDDDNNNVMSTKTTTTTTTTMTKASRYGIFQQWIQEQLHWSSHAATGPRRCWILLRMILGNLPPPLDGIGLNDGQKFLERDNMKNNNNNNNVVETYNEDGIATWTIPLYQLVTKYCNRQPWIVQWIFLTICFLVLGIVQFFVQFIVEPALFLLLNMTTTTTTTTTATMIASSHYNYNWLPLIISIVVGGGLFLLGYLGSTRDAFSAKQEKGSHDGGLISSETTTNGRGAAKFRTNH